MKKELDENLLHLTELYCRKGHVSAAQFGENRDKMDEFLRKNGLTSLAMTYSMAAGRYDAAGTREGMLAAKADMNAAAQQIKDRVRDIIRQTEGIDLEAIYGKQPTREEALAMLHDQFTQLGLDENTIRTLGLEDIDRLLEEGSPEFSFSVKDTEQARRAFDGEDIAYTAKDGRLHAKARIHASEGVSVDDTPENRRILDENEIAYIDMAMNVNPHLRKQRLMVPSTWLLGLYDEFRNESRQMTSKLVNTQMAKNFMLMAVIIGSSATFAFHPIYGLAAFLVIRKTGLLKSRGPKEAQPTMFEKKALKAGHTVYKESNMNGGKKCQYLFMHDGNVIRVNASDVRIPEYIRGVHLSAAQREQFRKGEPLELVDAKGHSFVARIDVTRPEMYREYYWQMQSDREAIPVPDSTSPDIDKLEYIARRGMRGIRDIYGKALYNEQRDAFLSRYKMTGKFADYNEAVNRFKNTQDPTQQDKYRAEFKKADQSLCEIAENAVLSLRKGNKRGL